jgi:hypothetical protein
VPWDAWDEAGPCRRRAGAVIRADRSLLVFPVVAGLGALIAVAAFGGAGAGLYARSAPVMSVFKVALYRFATEDRVVGLFERAQLEAAFPPRGRTGRATV